MSPDRRQYFFIVSGLVLIMIGLAIIFVKYASLGERWRLVTRPSVVWQILPGKVLYDPTVSTNMSDYQKDCNERGGDLDTCATPCRDGARECLSVCVLACVLPSGQEGSE